MMVTIQQAVEFIRKNDVLKKWTDAEIYDEIARAIFNNALVYSTDKNGVICGICFGDDFKDEMRLHVKCILGHGHLKSYIDYFKKHYPDYVISAYRDGVFKILKI